MEMDHLRESGNIPKSITIPYRWLLIIIFIFIFIVLFLFVPFVSGEWINIKNVTGFGEFRQVEYTPGSSNNISIQVGSQLQFWDYLNESLIENVSLPEYPNQYSFSKNGQLLAIASSGISSEIVLSILFYPNFSIYKQYSLGEFASVTCLDWFDSNSELIIGQSDGTCSILSLFNSSIIFSKKFDRDVINCIAVAPNSEFFGVGLSHDVLIYTNINYTEITRLSEIRASELSWSHDSNFLAITSYYTNSIIYSLLTKKIQNKYNMQDIIRFSPIEDVFLYINAGYERISIISILDSHTEFEKVFYDDRATICRWNENGTIFCIAYTNKIIRFYFNSSAFPKFVLPTVEITSPIDLSNVSKNTLIQGTASHSNGIQYVLIRIDDNPWKIANGTTYWNLLINFSLYSNGLHKIIAISSNGLAQSKPFIITINNLNNDSIVELPWITIISPLNNSIITESRYIYGISGGPLSINYIEIRINNGSWEMTLGQYNWKYYLDISSYNTGYYTISARSSDSYRISEIEHIIVKIERETNSPPVIYLDSPNEMSNISSVTIIKGKANDTDGINLIQYKIDGISENWINAIGQENWEISINTIILRNGIITISIKAIDNYSVYSISKFSFIISNPSYLVNVKILYPVHHQNVYGNINITYEFNNFSNIKEAFIYIGNFSKGIVPDNNNGHFILNTNLFDNGYQTILIVVISIFNYISYDSVEIDVQNIYIPPLVTIEYPQNGTTQDSNFNIRGKAYDDLIVISVQCKINYGNWMNCTGTEEWNIFINISDLNPGLNIIQIRAYDSYIYSEPLTLEIIKPNPNLRPREKFYQYLILLLIIIIVVLFILLMKLRMIH